METQTVMTTPEACPKDIVQQLLEIAKENGALDEIGGATSWRWQEGIISRMPKTKTVAKILRKAYNTDDPYEWYKNTIGSLKLFIKNSMLAEGRFADDFEPKDIYEAFCMYLIGNERGVLFEELVLSLSELKFIKCNQEYDDHLFTFDTSLAKKVYGNWAKEKVSNFFNLYNIEKDQFGYYKLSYDPQFTSERMAEYLREIQCLRFKVVGKGSIVDMWRDNFVALTDDEMIHIEKLYLKLQEKVSEEISKVLDNKSRDVSSATLRIFSLTATSHPRQYQGGLL